MITLRPPQLEVFLSPQRFRLLAAGRRFGKTYLALAELMRAAWTQGKTAWYVAPTYKQAKRVAWNPLKQMTRPFWDGRPSETDLSIDLKGGGRISLRGADAYDSLRGEGLDFVVLDEFASMAASAWHAVLRPMLADRLGEALFIGTPRGYNHFYELYSRAAKQPDWSAFHFTTEDGGNVSPEELRAAARDMDEKLYRQEFRASFEELNAGRVYWAFDRTRDVGTTDYDNRNALCWSIDFNIDPACSVLCQIDRDQVYVLEEIALRNSNTLAVCEEFARRSQRYLKLRWCHGPIEVRVFGDATGTSRDSAASRTDWQIVKDFFNRNQLQYRATFEIPSGNPPVKDRINCVNTVIQNAEGDRRLRVAPTCEELIRDLEQVSWKTDAHGNTTGELNHSDPARTHTSDALGYLIARKFAMYGKFGEVAHSLF